MGFTQILISWVVSQRVSYSPCSALLLTRAPDYGPELWSKVVHYIGNRVRFGVAGDWLTQTLVRVIGCSSPPGTVVVERLAHIAVIALRVVLAVANRLAETVIFRTLTRMAIALAPGTAENSGVCHRESYNAQFKHLGHIHKASLRRIKSPLSMSSYSLWCKQQNWS
jgi:hypothetical protein